MDEIGRGGCLSQKQYDIVVRFLSQGYFPTKGELMDANFANQEDTARPRPFRKFKSWTQRLLYRESENALIHLPTGKVVVPKEHFIQIILTNHCNITGGHLTAYATMRKIQQKYTFGRRNFGMNEELVRSVIRNCPFCENIRPKTTKPNASLETDRIPVQPYFIASNQSKQEQHPETQTEKLPFALTITNNPASLSSVAPSSDSLAQSSVTERKQSDTAMEWKSGDINNNKTDVKQTHPIIHNTLLTQLQSAGSSMDTNSCQNRPVSFPLLGPIGIQSILPSKGFSNINLATPSTSAQTSLNTGKISLTSNHSLLSKEPFLTAAKTPGNKLYNGSLSQQPRSLGCYIKVPNSTSQNGFSLSYVSTPFVSLSHSTVCSPSIASLPRSSVVAPHQIPSNVSATKMVSAAEKSEITVHLSRSQTDVSKLIPKNKITVITPDQLKPQAKRPALTKASKQSKSLPPIKPKEETELAKVLLNSEEGNARSSGVPSTSDKQSNVSKKDASMAVLKKLKMKLGKLGKKVKRTGKQKKVASPSSGKGNDDVKEDKATSANPVDESHQKKKIIVINPEKMKKLLENSLKGLNMNINFKGKCNVIFHNESSGSKTSFRVDEGSTAGFLSSSTSDGTANPNNPGTSKTASSVDVEVESCVKEKNMDEKQQCVDLVRPRPVIAEQVMKEYLCEKGNDLFHDVNGLVGTTSTKSQDKTSLHSMLPNPGPIPSPSIWTFSADMMVEKNCYRRLLIAIQDMKTDIMKSILSDHNAIERLRKKIGYAESLVNKHKTFISNHHKDLNLN